MDETDQEASRLAALNEPGILDTAAQQAYNDITELAALICGTPISSIALAGQVRRFNSASNLPLTAIPRDPSFCARTLETAEMLVVEDAARDPRFAGDPLVTGDLQLRFYAGAPIVRAGGAVIGTICVMDRVPRSLSSEQRDGLARLARHAAGLLDGQAIAQKAARLEAEVTASADEAGRQREALQLSLDAAGVATWYYDPIRNVVGGDTRIGRLFGVTEPEAPAEVWIDAVFKADRSRVGEAFAASVAGAPYDIRFRVVVDGAVRWLRSRAKSIPQQDGSVRLAGVCEDVTREEDLTQDLAESEASLQRERQTAADRLNLESERLEMSLVSSNATSFDWRPATDEVKWGGMPPFGADPATIPTGASSMEYVQVDDRAGLAEVLAKATEDGQPYAFEYRARWSNGSTRWIRTAGRATRELDGSTRFLGVNTDVTERKLAEEALLHTEKLSAVGRLATVISHEINNPLEAVTNLLYIVRASPNLTREDREHLELADRELARVSQVTAQTLRFHRSVDRPGLIDADKMVQELVSLYRSRLEASSIRTKLNLAEDVVFHAYEGDIRQVLNHLIGNAFDAMRKGGRLQIRTRRCTDAATGEQGVSITVADNGPGIPQEDRQRIFEAFYSTKGINGTGLGLWHSKLILQKHKGRLTFRTAAGAPHGSVFRLWLPLQVTE